MMINAFRKASGKLLSTCRFGALFFISLSISSSVFAIDLRNGFDLNSVQKKLEVEPLRKPYSLESLSWEWVEVPGSQCRNGSTAGYFQLGNPDSKNLMIFLEGGGACFNAITCGVNPDRIDTNLVPPNSGILALEDENNPVKDWNAVFVPYCTGDVMIGDNPDGRVSSRYSGEKFVGYSNMTTFVENWIKDFEGAEQVLLTGESAGGFGAIYNFDQVQEAFGETPVVLLDDSGVIFSDEYLAPCLQQRWRNAWGINSTLPLECLSCRNQSNGGGFINYVDYLFDKYPEKQFALISSLADTTIRAFYGFGNNNCRVLLPYTSARKYTAGLYDLRDSYSEDSFVTYYIDGSTHTFIGSSRFYSTSVRGKPLNDWVADVLAQNATSINP